MALSIIGINILKSRTGYATDFTTIRKNPASEIILKQPLFGHILVNETRYQHLHALECKLQADAGIS